MRLNFGAKNAYITSVPDPEFDGKNRLCGTSRSSSTHSTNYSINEISLEVLWFHTSSTSICFKAVHSWLKSGGKCTILQEKMHNFTEKLQFLIFLKNIFN